MGVVNGAFGAACAGRVFEVVVGVDPHGGGLVQQVAADAVGEHAEDLYMPEFAFVGVEYLADALLQLLTDQDADVVVVPGDAALRFPAR